MTPRIGSLCSGYGGLDMGVQQVIGGTIAWHCEYEAAPSKILAHHWPGVPNHHDLTTTDWAAVEPVDVITAGWPCQPWSPAGKRRGEEDERAIWPAIADAVRALRPRYVFLENVARVVTVGELARVAGSLAELGYVGAWRCLRASDVGAPHKRDRCFVVAEDADRAASSERRVAASGQAEGRRAWANAGGRGGALAAHTGGQRRDGHAGVSRTGRDTKEWGEASGDLGDCAAPRGTATNADYPAADGERSRPEPEPRGASSHANGNVQWGKYGPAIHGWEPIIGRPAPPPTEPGPRGGRRLSPRFVEHMMGLPEGHVTDVPGVSRNDQLKALGNGCVPQQAAAAYRSLLVPRSAERAA